MSSKRIIPKFMTCKKPAVIISIIFQLSIIAGIGTLIYLAPYDNLRETNQTFITIYSFVCVLVCYIQFNTSIIPEDSRDLESLIFLVLFQVCQF